MTYIRDTEKCSWIIVETAINALTLRRILYPEKHIGKLFFNILRT